MHDEERKWSRLPGGELRLATPGLAIRSIIGLSQSMISGDLALATMKFGVDARGVGTGGLAFGGRYSVRLARDRMLIVTGDRVLPEQGWRDGGYALTEMSAALAVFEIRGTSANEVIKRGTDLPVDGGSPSAALVFAGVNAILYRFEDALRLHVDRGHAAFLWQWLGVAAEFDAGESDGGKGRQAGRNALAGPAE
ncbi:hypothetical protein [Oryzicola mucosus]|uniref:Uncharacterized protein n=1 Tax=Oryzicola mucosus TaxID=2767425 RepID=A0A8J6PNP2_9HYPH|nr:hypothetical protein [Oryzicola mucosus]MBD0416886.1 hypothetical protein [Oryzicola mucosus]